MNHAENKSFNKKYAKEKFTDFNTPQVVMSRGEEAKKKNSSKKEASLMYFRLFPAHRNVSKRIPKKNENSKTIAEIDESQSAATESIVTQNMEYKPTIEQSMPKQSFGAIGSYKDPYMFSNVQSRKRRHSNYNKGKLWQNKRQKCFDALSEYNVRDYRNYSQNKNVSPEPDAFVQPSNQSPYPRPHQSFNQTTVKNTIVQVEEKMMSIQSANGNKQLIHQKVRHIVNTETSVLNMMETHEV